MSQTIHKKSLMYITPKELPFACPPLSLPQFSHPKVFLKFKQNVAHCPYCGTTYIVGNPNDKER